eukprot:scaffold8592_cov54-Attheya_sp.AAC.2
MQRLDPPIDNPACIIAVDAEPNFPESHDSLKAQLLQPFHPDIFEFLLSLQMKRKANIAQGLDAGFGQSAVDMKSALRHDPPSQVATPANGHI